MMLIYYNMLPSIKAQDLFKGKYAPWLRGTRLKVPTQKTAISRMLARSAHIPREHHLNPPQQPRIAKYKTLQRKTQRLAERQQTLAPQANEQPPKPKGKKRQQPSEYELHNQDISYSAVQPLDPENGASSLWDYKKGLRCGNFQWPMNDPWMNFQSLVNFQWPTLLTICTNTICKLQKW